jgi:hypothetical protein
MNSKKQDPIHCVWTSDTTKNHPQDIFERHVKVFCEEDEYMKKTKVGNLQVDEDVRGQMTPKWYLKVPGHRGHIKGSL